MSTSSQSKGGSFFYESWKNPCEGPKESFMSVTIEGFAVLDDIAWWIMPASVCARNIASLS
jgi:hypothetical protein